MLADILTSGDGLEIGLVVVLLAAAGAVRGWYHSLDKRLALLEQAARADRSGIHRRDSE